MKQETELLTNNSIQEKNETNKMISKTKTNKVRPVN